MGEGGADVEVAATAAVKTAVPPPEIRSEKVTVGLRAAGCVFSFLAFLLMVTNQHGDWKEFDKYEEYRCVDVSSSSWETRIPDLVSVWWKICRGNLGLGVLVHGGAACPSGIPRR